MNSISQLIHTVRYLQPIQVINRLYRKATPFRKLPTFTSSHCLVPRAPQPLAWRDVRHIDGATFTFLNDAKTFLGKIDWEAPLASHLWTYNLHYFQYLRELSSRRGTQLIIDWIQNNTTPNGVGFEPYVLSMRVREWLEWLHDKDDISGTDRDRIVASIAQQAEALHQQLEYHLLGNHLLENAITLCWAGVSLNGPAASKWLHTGTAILKRELKRQVLSDGAHDERSPMYQALISEGLLRLSAICFDVGSPHATALRALIHPFAKRLVKSLGYMVHPDGEYALVNDCALGVAPLYSELLKRFNIYHLRTDTHIGTWLLPDAGYAGHRSAKGTYLFFDAGPIGPGHQPGHGHADTLSFEMSLFKKRIICDTGIYSYERTPHREYTRSTAAHTTVEIDKQNSSDVWASFRCGKRATTYPLEIVTSSDTVTLLGQMRFSLNNGFTEVTQSRQLILFKNALFIHDNVRAPGTHTLHSRIHMAPDVQSGDSKDTFQIPGTGKFFRLNASTSQVHATQTPFHPQFGISIPRACNLQQFSFENSAQCDWRISW